MLYWSFHKFANNVDSNNMLGRGNIKWMRIPGYYRYRGGITWSFSPFGIYSIRSGSLKNLENTRSGYVPSFLLQVQHWPHNHLKDKSCHGNWISNCEQPLCEAIRQNQSWLVFHNHLTLISKYPSLLSAYPSIGLSAQLTYFHLNKWNSTH